MVMATFATFREDIMDSIHFLGRQKFPLLAFMAGLTALFAFALSLAFDLFHVRRI